MMACTRPALCRRVTCDTRWLHLFTLIMWVEFAQACHMCIWCLPLPLPARAVYQRLLQDSLGGNTVTTVIATVSPSALCADETISTLKFADRARRVMVRVRANEIIDDAELLVRARVRVPGLVQGVVSLHPRVHAARHQIQTSAAVPLLHPAVNPSPEGDRQAQAAVGRRSGVYLRWRHPPRERRH